MRGRLILFVGLLSLTASLLFSQTATLTGRITDATGSIVPQVRITVTNEGTAQKSITETNFEGYYTVAPLQPGTYSIDAQKPGFAAISQRRIQLVVNQVARLDMTLQLAAVAESIEVTAQAVLLESETATRGHLVQGVQLTELPLLGRNSDTLAGLVPGVRTTRSAGDIPVAESSSFISVNGARGLDNTFLLDGAPNTAPHAGWGVVHAAADSIQEFKVETGNYSAEYGRTLGGIFNVVTKGGTNDFHATAWEYLRNTKLNANGFFANREGLGKVPLRFNQFGWTAAGPVELPGIYHGRNRTFFFGSAELMRQAQGVTSSGTVPRPHELGGDFSNTLNSSGQLIAVYDPVTTALQPNGTYLRQPFPGNIIPSNRVDPVARNIAALWPLPTQPGHPLTAANNFWLSQENQTTSNNISGRVDHYITQRNRLMGRMTGDNATTTYAPSFGQRYAGVTTGFKHFPLRAYSAIVEDTYVLGPSSFFTIRASYTRQAWDRVPYPEQKTDYTALGFPASLPKQLPIGNLFPDIRVTGYSGLGYSQISHFGWDQGSIQGQFAKTFSRHMLKAGGEYRVFRYNCMQILDSPIFSFGANFTQGPNAAASSLTAGKSVATFLLGLASGNVNVTPAWAAQILYSGIYVQDDWKVFSRLTLNLGLRWEVNWPLTERYNQIATFDYNAAVPLQIPGLTLKGALTFPGVNGNPRGVAETDLNNFAPRVGLAFRATPNTVIRGGVGIFYGNPYGSWRLQQGTSGFGATSTLVTSLNGVTPLNYLSNPYPDGLLRPVGSSLGASTLLGQTLQFYDRGNRTPYSEQWNLTIQRQFPGAILLDVAYSGSHSLKLVTGQRTGRNHNQLPSEVLAMGSALVAQVPNPFYGKITSGILAQPTVSRGQLLRRFPQFDGVESINGTWGTARYDALQAKVERRFSKGLTVMVSYVFSKAMDDASYFWGESFSSSEGEQAIQNWNNLRGEWAVGMMDQTHRLTAATVYGLPFFKQQRGFAGRLLGGWAIGTIITKASGAPLGIFAASNTTNSGAGIMRPNWNGQNQCISDPTPARWFNTSVFSFPPPYTFGNAPRTFGGCRQDGTKQLDVSVHKSVRVLEKLEMKVSLDLYNLTNTPQFGGPGNTFGNPAFGVVTSQNNRPRIVEVSARLSW